MFESQVYLFAFAHHRTSIQASMLRYRIAKSTISTERASYSVICYKSWLIRLASHNK